MRSFKAKHYKPQSRNSKTLRPEIIKHKTLENLPLLGGSWDLVSKVISTLSGVISNYKYSYLNYNPS